MDRNSPILRRAAFLFLSCLIISSCFSQNYFFGEGPINWDLRKPFEMPPEVEKYSTSDLVILNDVTEFQFYSTTHEKLVRTIKYKINTQKGLEELKHFKVPESFDYGFDRELNNQGRRARINTPDMKEYTVKVFAARKFSRLRWSNVIVKDRYETIKKIKPTGEFADESISIFDLGTIAIGDMVEIYYEVYFNSQYGSNMFILTGLILN